MKTVLHKAATRGHADHGWLNSWHTFSFAGYNDPSRMHFGTLRVLNDDTVAGGMGFGKHPHDNMEIISIPLEGDLQHSDDIGNTTIIRQGDVQVMSAGTGVTHSEKNANNNTPVKFLQIWIFPAIRNAAPRYDQRSFNVEDKQNKLLTVVSPIGDPAGVAINQNAWFSLANLDQDVSLTYTIKAPGNGVYAFVLEGSLMINEIELNQRDGLGITETNELSIKALSKTNILLMEVPMQ